MWVVIHFHQMVLVWVHPGSPVSARRCCAPFNPLCCFSMSHVGSPCPHETREASVLWLSSLPLLALKTSFPLNQNRFLFPAEKHERFGSCLFSFHSLTPHRPETRTHPVGEGRGVTTRVAGTVACGWSSLGELCHV